MIRPIRRLCGASVEMDLRKGQNDMQVESSEEKGEVDSPVYTEVRVGGGVLGPSFPCCLWGDHGGAGEPYDGEVPVKASSSLSPHSGEEVEEGRVWN